MPRYFFHVLDGVDVRDDDGTECADLAEARQQAVRASGEMIRYLGDKFWEHDEDWQMNVTDADGAYQFTLRFSPK